MAVDHSLTYKNKSLKNFLHIYRLKSVLTIIDRFNLKSGLSYIDVGSSNGYLTNIISRNRNFKCVTGVDHNDENLAIAKTLYPDIIFSNYNLNDFPNNHIETYDFITCLETLEHVGNLDNALHNLLNLCKTKGSIILISVPIEIKVWGIIKFLTKIIYGYRFNELKSGTSRLNYFITLITSSKINKYRGEKSSWGTHFGFDYRLIDSFLNNESIIYESKNVLSTRFYIITNK